MINNTHMSVYICPLDFHVVVGTWTQAAGAVAGTIALHKAAAAETAVVTLPIQMPGNSVALQGSKLVSVEVDFEIQVADLTSIAVVLNKVTRANDLAAAVVAAVAQTCTPTVALAKVLDQHKLVVTLTTPEWVNSNTYYLLQLTCVAPATTTLDFLAAVANFTLRV
jgi:hypothetical protein